VYVKSVINIQSVFSGGWGGGEKNSISLLANILR
jgi:hypothetical protein